MLATAAFGQRMGRSACKSSISTCSGKLPYHQHLMSRSAYFRPSESTGRVQRYISGEIHYARTSELNLPRSLMPSLPRGMVLASLALRLPKGNPPAPEIERVKGALRASMSSTFLLRCRVPPYSISCICLFHQCPRKRRHRIALATLTASDTRCPYWC